MQSKEMQTLTFPEAAALGYRMYKQCYDTILSIFRNDCINYLSTLEP